MAKTAENKETFVVQILNTQNSTWQGTVTWTEGGKQEHFRSTLELIQLVDSALQRGHGQREQTERG